MNLVVNLPKGMSKEDIALYANEIMKIGPNGVSVELYIFIFDLIRTWAKEKGIFDKGSVEKQFIKLVEEVGELAHSIDRANPVEFKDAIGDCVVVLTSLAHLGSVSIEECIQSAYDEIKNRKGKMLNGTFIKDGQ